MLTVWVPATDTLMTHANQVFGLLATCLVIAAAAAARSLTGGVSASEAGKPALAAAAQKTKKNQ